MPAGLGQPRLAAREWAVPRRRAELCGGVSVSVMVRAAAGPGSFVPAPRAGVLEAVAREAPVRASGWFRSSAEMLFLSVGRFLGLGSKCRLRS